MAVCIGKQPNATAEQQNNQQPDCRMRGVLEITPFKNEMHQFDGILEQEIEPGERKQLFRFILLLQKALCQIAGHENKPRHVKKIDKGSHACGKGGMDFLQIA